MRQAIHRKGENPDFIVEQGLRKPILRMEGNYSSLYLIINLCSIFWSLLSKQECGHFIWKHNTYFIDLFISFGHRTWGILVPWPGIEPVLRGGIGGKEPACQCRRHKRCWIDPWVGKTPWGREWQPIPVFLPGKSHTKRSLAGVVHGVTELDTTEAS